MSRLLPGKKQQHTALPKLFSLCHQNWKINTDFRGEKTSSPLDEKEIQRSDCAFRRDARLTLVQHLSCDSLFSHFLVWASVTCCDDNSSYLAGVSLQKTILCVMPLTVSYFQLWSTWSGWMSHFSQIELTFVSLVDQQTKHEQCISHELTPSTSKNIH